MNKKDIKTIAICIAVSLIVYAFMEWERETVCIPPLPEIAMGVS